MDKYKAKCVVLLREHTGSKKDVFRKNMIVYFNSEKVPYVRYNNHFWEVVRNPYCEDEYLSCGRMQKLIELLQFGYKYSEIVYCNKFVAKPAKPAKPLKATILFDSDRVLKNKLIKFNTAGVPYIMHQRLFWEVTEVEENNYVTTGRVQNVLSGSEFGHRIESVYTVENKRNR